MKRLALILTLLIGALPLITRAFVQNYSSTGAGYHWNLTNPPAAVHTNVVNRTTKAVRYYLASDGWSATNKTAELNALRASFAQWQAISNTVLKFEEVGLLAPPVDVNTDDHTNLLYWTKLSTLVDGGLSDISGALGVTFNVAQTSGLLLEADIVFNGVEKGWYTDFSNATSTDYFVEGVALHEIGHYIGLDHSPLGAASMFAYNGRGITPQTGLSSDDIAGAKFIYGQASQSAQRAAIRGTVTRNGSGILGAVIVAERTNGITEAATVSKANGIYELSALPPGSYQVRVTPLDSPSSSDPLIIGADISTDYSGAQTSFLPTTNVLVTLNGGATNTLNFAVAPIEPAFRIGYIRSATTNAGSFSWAALPTTLRQGQINVTVGVASPNLPTNNATLTISGDGLTVLSTVFRTNAFNTGYNFISLTVNVASNATPGLRSFLVQQGTNRAYANGFLDVVPLSPDYNFDGLDDYYQRKYFPVFTSTNAAPSVDPDNDKYNNSAEYMAGTNPTNAASLLKIEQVIQTAAGTRITWQSDVGKRYQVLSRSLVGTGAFQPVGAPVTGTGPTTQFLDTTGTNGIKFYRVQAIP